MKPELISLTCQEICNAQRHHILDLTNSGLIEDDGYIRGCIPSTQRPILILATDFDTQEMN